MNSELSMNQVLIEKLTNILEDNLDKECFGVKELARKVGLSRSQLHRKLKSIEGKSTSRFIREFRLQKAMEMLQNNVATASEIAYCVGFNSPTYFNTCFHDYYGYPPGEVKFRNSIENQDKKDFKDPESKVSFNIKEEIDPIKKNRFNRRMVWVNTVVIILLSILIYNLYQKYKSHFTSELSLTESNEKSIALLPFKMVGDSGEDQYFADGMMYNILNHLSSIDGLMVISGQSSENYRDSDKTATQIGSELEAHFLLEGSVQKHKDSARITIQLIDTKSDYHVWSGNYDFELKQVFAVQSEISKQIANELKTVIPPVGIEQIDKKPTENLEAYNLYLKGRFFWHRRHEEDLNKSIYYFNKALELDSTYALAFAGMADTHFVMTWHGSIPQNEAFSKAKKFAQKAILIDNTIAEAHATLGGIATWNEWNWNEAEKKIKKAISLNPNYATAYQWYAELLDVLDRSNEAIEQIVKALKLNPNSCMMHSTCAMLNVKAGNYDKAIVYAKKAKEIDKTQGWSYWILFESYWNKGMDDAAIAEMEEWWNLEPNIELAKGSRKAYNKAGIKGVYKYIIDYDLKMGYASNQPCLMAQKYAFIGEVETALDWLEKAYEKRINGISADLGIAQIKSDPYFKSLRSEPRFLALLDKMNLGDYN